MSSSYSIKGIVHLIGETKQVSDRFRKRDLVLDVQDGKYPQSISFQVSNDRCDLLNEYKDGDEISVEFNVRGREWRSPSGEVKYFNTLEAWKIDRVGPAKSRGGAHEPAPAPPQDDGIPF
jgi:hypothetical protein